MHNPKRALITGVNGQDGIYLSRLLVSFGYQVLGVGNQNKPSKLLPENISYVNLDIRDTNKFIELLASFRPTELYNLAGKSSVSDSFHNSSQVMEINYHSLRRLLEESMRLSPHRNIKFFQASSSEMFGNVEVQPQDEFVPFSPISPYAESKLAAHETCLKFRSMGLFVSTNILYNHESHLRPEKYLTRKIARAAAEIELGLRFVLEIGDTSIERDWGYAGDYVQAMYLTLQSDVPDDFIIASGKSTSVAALIEIAFEEAGIRSRLEDCLKIEQRLFRPREIRSLVGNPQKARQHLGWEPQRDIGQVVREMVRIELEELKNGTILGS